MIGPFGLRPKGTMAVRALPLAKALAGRGHAVSMFLPPWSYPQDAGRKAEEERVRIENVAISPKALISLRLVRKTLEWKPDVIHFFKPKAYSGLSAWLLWQLRKVGGIHTKLILDEDDWEGAGGWNEIENYNPLYKRFFAWQEKWGLNHCDAVTVASRALETIVRSLGRPDEQVYYLPYGLTPFATADRVAGQAVRRDLGIGVDPVVLLYTRFFEFHVERIVQVFARVISLVPNARFLIVGKGLFGEEDELLKLTRERNLTERIVYVGWAKEGNLPGIFAAADVAIYPFDDTLVNRCKCAVKLGDLLSAGVPVIAESVGQSKEYIQNNETGVLVPAGSVEEFACATANLLRDDGLRGCIGRNASAHMAREYNWERWVKVAEQAYEAGGVGSTKSRRR